MKNLLFVLLLLSTGVSLLAQSPSSFNYQAVARDVQNQILSEQDISLKISILEESASGNAIYTEEHLIKTSKLGVLNLQVGEGSNTSGAISSIGWGNKTHWLQVEMDVNAGSNYLLMGASQLVSVPYAMHAKTAELVDDADADPSNEFQTLSVTGNQLTLSDGNTVNLPTGGGSGSDNDEDPNNEVQSLTSSKSGSEVKLNISLGGSSTTINIEDADANSTNEIQNLNFNTSNNVLSLSDGGQVDLSSLKSNSGGSGTDDQQLSLSGTQLSIEDGNTIDLSILKDGVDDADADATNEIQTISKNGNTVSLSKNGGSYIDEVNDADADATNEIQTIGFNVATNILSLTNGGQVDLSALDGNSGGSGSGTDNQVLSLSGTQLSIEDGNTVDLSVLQDGVNDADADSKNEIQNLSLKNHVLSLSKSDSTIFMGEYISPWVEIPLTETIVHSGIIPSAIVKSGDDTAELLPDGLLLSDNASFSSSYINGLMAIDTITSITNNSILVRNMFEVNKNRLLFQSGNSNSPTLSRLDKGSLRFSDVMYGSNVTGELNANNLTMTNGSEDTRAYISPYGLRSKNYNPSTPSNKSEIEILLGTGFGVSAYDGNGNQDISSTNAANFTLGNGPEVGNFDFTYMNLNRDSLVFMKNTPTQAYASYGREQIVMNRESFTNSIAKLGLDSIYMSSFVGILFPDAMTLKPSELKFQSEYKQSLLKDDGLVINDLSSFSGAEKRVELNTDLTMYNGLSWKNIKLGTPTNGDAGQLDIWSGTGDFKLAELGVDSNDGLGGSLRLYSENAGNISYAWLRAHDKIGELELHGPNSINTFIGSLGDGNRGVIQVFDEIATGTSRASMYVDENNNGVIYADFLNIGENPNNNSQYAMKVLQRESYGFNLVHSAGVEDWEFFVNPDGHLELYANGNNVGNFDPSNGTYSSVSDFRLKKDIEAISTMLPSLMLLKPSKYKYKNNNPLNNESIGFIAQDVQRVFPELVSESKTKEGKEILTVDYAGFGVVAIKAIQEQQHVIEAQQKLITTQQSALNKMKERIDRIEILLGQTN